MPPSASPSPQWQHIASTTLSDAAYLAVRDQIVAGQISPGEFIRERFVSEALRVSRTPLREAFGRLATEGFLERVPNQGYRVPTTPIQDLLDLYPVVTSLEVLAAGAALQHLTKEDVDTLRQLNRAMLDAIADHDAVGSIRANELFHRQLTARSGNRRLGRLLDDLRAQLSCLEIWSATQPELCTEAVQQHKAIIQAVARRDYATAVRVLEANRMQTYTALTASVAQQRALSQVADSEPRPTRPQRARQSTSA